MNTPSEIGTTSDSWGDVFKKETRLQQNMELLKANNDRMTNYDYHGLPVNRNFNNNPLRGCIERDRREKKSQFQEPSPLFDSKRRLS
ncbi:hypothetical protein RB195_016830 [Necator americanus]|uniref:Uncharacterized protein n=1 Tax=Necator americanus TaxID=51031 RepID=A0ABR1C2B6_NECAM